MRVSAKKSSGFSLGCLLPPKNMVGGHSTTSEGTCAACPAVVSSYQAVPSPTSSTPCAVGFFLPFPPEVARKREHGRRRHRLCGLCRGTTPPWVFSCTVWTGTQRRRRAC